MSSMASSLVEDYACLLAILAWCTPLAVVGGNLDELLVEHPAWKCMLLCLLMCLLHQCLASCQIFYYTCLLCCSVEIASQIWRDLVQASRLSWICIGWFSSICIVVLVIGSLHPNWRELQVACGMYSYLSCSQFSSNGTSLICGGPLMLLFHCIFSQHLISFYW